WYAPKGDILIVLGAETVDSFIGESSYWRTLYATLVWRQGSFQKVVISGGSADPGAMPIARPMKEFLTCQGVPETAIQIETESTTTSENALNTAKLLGSVAGRKVLLSSDYHTFRAYRSFRKAGLDVVPSPFPDAAKRVSFWWKRWPAFVDLCVEISKIGY